MCFWFLVERTETVADVKTLLKTLGNLSEAGRCILNHENAGRFSQTPGDGKPPFDLPSPIFFP